MRILRRICISFIFISIALILTLFIRNVQSLLTPTTYLILITGSGINLIAAISLFLIIICQLARERKEITPKRIKEILRKNVYGLKEEHVEGKLLFAAGSIAAYLKCRGTAITRLTRSGEYLPYENFKKGLILAIEDVERVSKFEI